MATLARLLWLLRSIDDNAVAMVQLCCFHGDEVVAIVMVLPWCWCCYGDGIVIYVVMVFLW